MPFQELSKRKRKDVKVEDIKVRVCLFAFDLLYLNGEVIDMTCPLNSLLIVVAQPLLQQSLIDRRALLRDHFTPVPGEFEFAKSNDGETTDEIQTFLEESVKDGCEGLMVKMLDTDASFYEPSRRSVNWLKVIIDMPSKHTNSSIFAAQERLSCRGRRFARSRRRRRLLRQRQANKRVRRIPAGLL